MAKRFNVIVSAKNIPDSSWDTWIAMGYNYPIDYLRETYGATEVKHSADNMDLYRRVRFHSRKSYMEFCLRWL